MLTTPSRLFSSVLSISRRSLLARRWRWKWNWRLRTSNLTFHLSRAWEILAWEAGIGNRYHFRQFLSFLPLPWVSKVFFFLAPQADRSSAKYPSHETYPKPETAYEKSLGSRVSFRLIKVKKAKNSCEPQGNCLKPLSNSCPKFLNTLWCPSLNLFGSAAMSHSLIPLVKEKKPASEKMFLPLLNIIYKNWSTSSVISRVYSELLWNPKNKKSGFSRFSDNGCFGLIGDQIAPFTIYFFRNWQYLCVFLSSCPRSLVFLLWQTRSWRLQSAWRWSFKITSRLLLKSLRLRARNTLLNRYM